MKISIYPPLSIHEIGQRDNQEDSMAQWDNHLFVLCDGMGGHEKGEVASLTVCQSLVKWFQENITDDSFSDEQLRSAIEYAYTELDKFDDDSPKKMGTTLTLLYIGKEGATAAHMGDSRIYHIRPNVGILYQSRDHSLVFDLYQAGEITYEEMGSFAQKNIVTRAMTPGEENRMRPDIIHITDILPGDYYFLCSDGMLENMEDRDLLTILNSELSDDEKREQFVEISETSKDNHSAWLIHIKDVIHEEGDEKFVNEEPTARCNTLNIVPQPNFVKDVKVIDDDDVVVVSTPKPVKKKLPLQKLAIVVLSLILALVLAWILFSRNNDNKEQVRPEPMMRTPIMHDDAKGYKKDSNFNETNRFDYHESGD